MKAIKVLSVRKFKAGYEVRRELMEQPYLYAEVLSEGDDGEEAQEIADAINSSRPTADSFSLMEMKSAYTPTGDYIGSSKTAYRLCKKLGIAPEKIEETNNVCSIGFSEREQKWYGWSHRAIYGFSVGDEVKEGDCCATTGWTDEWLREHPEDDTGLRIGFVAKTLEGAKIMAIAFAESVG